MSKVFAQPIVRLRQLFQQDNFTLSALMVKGASGTFVLKIIYLGATFLTSILLARILGAKDYGMYAYAISWITLLGIFAKLGLNQVISRYIATYHQAQDWGRMRGLLRFSFATVSFASGLCLLSAALVAWFVYGEDDKAMQMALWLAFFLLPLNALLVPCGSVQQGLHQVVWAQTPSLLVRPVLFIISVAGAWSFFSDALSVNAVLVLYLLSTIFALFVAIFLLKRALPTQVQIAKPVYEMRSWLSGALPLVLMGSMYLVNYNADILMLASMRGPEEAGIYKAATRGSELIIMVLSVINIPLAPIITRLFNRGEKDKLQRVLTNATRAALLFGFLTALPLIFYSQEFLALFGAEFVAGDTALTVLVCGQLFNVAVGSVDIILVMTGNETKAAYGIALSAILNVFLNALLIPNWGIEGAAVATATSTIVWNLLLIWYVWRALKLDPTVLGLR